MIWCERSKSCSSEPIQDLPVATGDGEANSHAPWESGVWWKMGTMYCWDKSIGFASHRKGNFYSVWNPAIFNWLFKPSMKRSTFLYTRTFLMLIQKYWHLPNNINLKQKYGIKQQNQGSKKSSVKVGMCKHPPYQKKDWAWHVPTEWLAVNAAAFSSEAPSCFFSISFLSLLFA